MYTTTIQDIRVPYLHDAALTLSLRKDANGEQIFKFRSIYMDSKGECAISFYGRLTEQQIKEAIIHFCYPNEDKSYDNIRLEYGENYVNYRCPYDEYDNSGTECTTILTPDGLDFRTLKI